MDKRKIAARFSTAGGALLCIVGIAHTVGIIKLKDELSQQTTLRLTIQDQLLINWVFSGLVICLLGIVLIVLSSSIAGGKRFARNLATTTGSFFAVTTVAAYSMVPNVGLLFVFGAPALLVLIPLILFWKEFSLE